MRLVTMMLLVVFAVCAEVPARTAVLVEFHSFDANRKPAARYIHAVRSDGAEYLRHEKNGSAELVTVVDGSKLMYWRPEARMKSTLQTGYRANIYMPQRDPGSGCVAILGTRVPALEGAVRSEEVMTGMRVLREQSRHGRLLMTQWFASEYGCEMVRQVVESETSSGSQLVSVQELESLRRGVDEQQLAATDDAVEVRPEILLNRYDERLAKLYDGAKKQASARK